MNGRSLKTSLCCILAATTASNWAHIPRNRQDPIDTKVENLLKQMTLEEKVDMCHGGSGFGTKAIPRLGIHAWEMTDGPGGVRTNGRDKSTYFPTGVSLASTWDPTLIKRTGVAMGQEARFFGKDVLLGPAVNMIRTPLGGRSFEYMSEDPFLAGSLAVPYIQGVQSQGVAACIKHFAANSQEIGRDTIDAQVSERALQEIYLPAFKAGVIQGNALAVMNAYNRLQGTYCTANVHLNNEILKRDWGFKGVLMSDWGATHDTVGAALGGLDLEMPGSGLNDFMGRPLLKAVQDGKVPEAVIDDKVRRILRAILITDQNKPNGTPEANSPAHQALAKEIAENAITLLKNDRNILPLDANRLKSIAVIGPWTTALHGGGGGSSAIYPPYEITALAGITKRAGAAVEVRTANGTGFGEEPMRPVPASALHPDPNSTDTGLKAEYFENPNLSGEPKVVRVDQRAFFRWTGRSPVQGISQEAFSVRWTGVVVAPKDGMYKFGATSDDGSRVYFDGKLLIDNWGQHAVEMKTASIQLAAGSKHDLRVEYFQNGGDAEMRFGWVQPVEVTKSSIAEAADVAKKSDVAIVFVGTNHNWDSEGRDKPSMKLMGDQGKLVQSVAAANPRTIVVLINGSPVELHSWINRVPAVVEAWYPGMEGGNAIAEVLFGDVNPSGKLPVTFPVKLEDSPAHANGDYPGKNGKLKYDEGIYVGYRYFDTKKVKPEFPFGFGLSYTTFKFQNVRVEPLAQAHQARFLATAEVTNTGSRSGAEVVELYVHEPNPAIDRPEKELKGYQKVFLKPGESETVQIALDESSFMYFNPSTMQWMMDTGPFEVDFGTSSRNIFHRKTIQIQAHNRIIIRQQARTTK